MSKHITQKNDISTYLEFSNLQIASEAFIGNSQSKDPGTIIDGEGFKRINLILGNGHTSKFTETAADEFMQHWQVVEHITNTKTGFSGTLFEAKVDIPSAGIKAGDQVLSFRSTEFVDDEVRDSQATNSMEISDRGFAFGQISDLRDWVGQMRAKNLMKDHISVTGYSLGGHLATAFYKLNEEGAFPGLNIDRTYTFNGAGIGKLKDPKNMTLKEVLNQFKSIKENGANEVFKTELGKKTYQEIKEINDSALNINKETSEEEFQSFIDSMKKILADKKKDTMLYHDPASPELQKILNDINILENAIERISDINKEILRIKNFTDTEGSSNKVYNVKPKNVASLSIDYQIALGLASNNTESYGLKSGANRILRGDKLDTELKNNFYDIMGDTDPSMVALSQKHFGEDIRIGIEDQPISRGWYKWNATISSLYNLGVKLFVDHYGKNDFGDTHSIILLTDSLVTQELLKQLDDNFSHEKFKPILKLSSNILTQAGMMNDHQGVAEGDALENIINSISHILNIGTDKLTGNTKGGTWANKEDRDHLHKVVKKISEFINNNKLNGKFNITPSNNITPGQVRNDFGYFLALKHASPIILSAKNKESMERNWKEIWPDEYKSWQEDNTAIQKGNIPKNYTNEWIKDRTVILNIKNITHDENHTGKISSDIQVTDNSSPEDVADSRITDRAKEFLHDLDKYNYKLLDEENGISIEFITSEHQSSFSEDIPEDKHNKLISFAREAGSKLIGENEEDHLYGAGGDDILQGGQGSDHLEGGSGSDILIGDDDKEDDSAGNNVDTLYGGAGPDLLKGGKGKDQYYFNRGEIEGDIIEDKDGGELYFDGKRLEPTNAKLQHLGGRRWVLPADGHKPAETAADGTSGKLVPGYVFTIGTTRRAEDGSTVADLHIITPENEQLTIRDWAYKKEDDKLTGSVFKFSLPIPPKPEDPKSKMHGDQVAPFSDKDKKYYNWSATHWNYETGKLEGGVAAPGFNDALRGTEKADHINGLAGNDAIQGGEGDDLIEGNDGHDLLLGGKGSDRIFGGDGDDFLMGHSDGLEREVYWRHSDDKMKIPAHRERTHVDGDIWVVTKYLKTNTFF